MWFFGLIVVLLIGAVAVVASGRWGAMNTAYDDRPDMTVPARQALTSTDIESAQFAVGLRGYRMDEVDTLLERVAREVAERDRRIADLERAVAPIVEAPEGPAFTSRSSYDAAEFDDTGTQRPILVGGEFPAADESPAPAAPESSETATAEQPAVGRPAPEQPALEESVLEQSAEQPAVEQTAVDQSGAAEPQPGAQLGQVETSVDEDDKPDAREVPQTGQSAAANEYERLQAEARALLEAQSQPSPPRRTPADPAAEPPQPPVQQPPVQQPPVYEHEHQTPQAEPQDQQAPAEEEGWRFWPPADQQGAPAWPQPDANGRPGEADDDSHGRHSSAPGEGAYRRPS